MVKKTRWFEVKCMSIRGSLVRNRILSDIPFFQPFSILLNLSLLISFLFNSTLGSMLLDVARRAKNTVTHPFSPSGTSGHISLPTVSTTSR